MTISYTTITSFSSYSSRRNMTKPAAFLPCLLTYFLLFNIFSRSCVASNSSQISYSDHCSSFVPHSISKTYPLPYRPLGRFLTVYYTGGNSFLSPDPSSFLNHFSLDIKKVYDTETVGVLKIEAEMTAKRPSEDERSCTNCQAHRRRRFVFTSFPLEGFWSETSGKLCTLGSAQMKQGDLVLDLKTVLKLENVKNFSTVTTLVTGTLASFSSSEHNSYFEPISVLLLPQLTYDSLYEYTLIPEGTDDDPTNRIDAVKSLPLDLLPRSSFCGMGTLDDGFSLEYASGCDSSKNCSPISGIAGYSLNVLSIRGFGCQDKRLRVLIEFSKDNSKGFYEAFDPNATLVGEGYWDKNKLSITACRFLDVTQYLASARVSDDCSTRLNLWLPAILSIKETSGIVGQIWTDKSVNDSGYFEKITFRSLERRIQGFPDVKYEYTETDRARTSCPKAETVKAKAETYPGRNSHHMEFSMWVRDSTGRIGWGEVRFPVYSYLAKDRSGKASLPSSIVEADWDINSSNLANVSYKLRISMLPGVQLGERISLFNGSSILNGQVRISAEGIYDTNSGALCMVGCRNVITYDQTANMECEMLLKFQFPPLEEINNDGCITGRIESMRRDSDPLYFEPLEASSTSLLKIAKIFEK